MRKFIISIILGIIAGIIDTTPMIVQGLDLYSNLSAFIHWIVMGFIITYIVLDITSWLKGLIIAEISSIPIAILVFPHDCMAVISILAMSAVLGSLIGFLSDKYARKEKQGDRFCVFGNK